MSMIIITSCSDFSEINIKAQLEYAICAKKAVGTSNWISFNLKQEAEYNDVQDPDFEISVIYNYCKKLPSYSIIFSDTSQIIKVEKNLIYMINNTNNEITIIRKDKNHETSAYQMIKNNTEGYLRFLPYYGQLLGYPN